MVRKSRNDFDLRLFIAFDLRLLFVLAMEHTLLSIILDIWRQSLFLEYLHDAAL